MEEKKVMKEPEENSEWTKVTKLLASEIISGSRRESKEIICDHLLSYCGSYHFYRIGSSELQK